MGVWQLQVEFQEDAHISALSKNMYVSPFHYIDSPKVHFTNFVAAMAFVFVAFAIDPTARCKPCPVLDGKQCGPPINNNVQQCKTTKKGLCWEIVTLCNEQQYETCVENDGFHCAVVTGI
ncbi:hypothetical protein HBI56_112180 [Parastagonospora nodorum]|nr:hypothetical protein HBH53_131730 [Parastagonospora nodorum]KAH3981007.1 hypothetical protein HBH51_050540 [Parastagonospora nodorum]KAH4071917.1 hypothetical protein HBH50_070340 [Parastagonospora nodorum]KAH4094801.1 hypothetical protein HBH48_058600 [Parastagonospora nodorum]KAH4130195.1 hypothetical protein HBH47_024950 [Parastagonospora nodorum]